jgi:hypothetical protein
VNPSLTIYAWGLRVGDLVARRFQRQRSLLALVLVALLHLDCATAWAASGAPPPVSAVDFGARLRITSLRAAQEPGVELLEYLTPRTGRAH